MVEDTPDDVIHDLFAERIWPQHPLGRPIIGDRKIVQELGRVGRRLSTDALVGAVDGIGCALVPGAATPSREQELGRAVGTATACAGRGAAWAPPSRTGTTIHSSCRMSSAISIRTIS